MPALFAVLWQSQCHMGLAGQGAERQHGGTDALLQPGRAADCGCVSRCEIHMRR